MQELVHFFQNIKPQPIAYSIKRKRRLVLSFRMEDKKIPHELLENSPKEEEAQIEVAKGGQNEYIKRKIKLGPLKTLNTGFFHVPGCPSGIL